MTDDMPELTDDDFVSAIPARLRKRLIKGEFRSGDDVAALRRFVRLQQQLFVKLRHASSSMAVSPPVEEGAIFSPGLGD